MRGKTELRRNINQCPWQNYATHKRNKQIQCNGDLPLSYGYCSQDIGCPSCAGTLYKPNILIEQGRGFLFIECPCCDPVAFRKRVERLKDKLPKGSGPEKTPLSEAKDKEDFEKRRAEAMQRKQERLKRLK
ncbi:MAG: hypothetical protein Q8O67_07015 [Deltaproteobacteria bacterium]|nr:hypothetical protein [Deltaproteobacteria bacterium]